MMQDAGNGGLAGQFGRSKSPFARDQVVAWLFGIGVIGAWTDKQRLKDAVNADALGQVGERFRGKGAARLAWVWLDSLHREGKNGQGVTGWDAGVTGRNGGDGCGRVLSNVGIGDGVSNEAG
jgi:hypothetical protein